MRLIRTILAAALVAGVAAGCTPDRTTPVAPVSTGPLFKRMHVPPPPGIDGPGDTVTVVRRETPLASDITRSAVIGVKGGTVEIPEAGVRLVVPANAVKADVTFSITALAGGQAAYEFEPHGTAFPVALRLEQSTKGLLVPVNEPTNAGYFTDRSELSNEETVGTFKESRPGKRDDVAAKLSFDLQHFSGYTIAFGRTTAY